MWQENDEFETWYRAQRMSGNRRRKARSEASSRASGRPLPSGIQPARGSSAREKRRPSPWHGDLSSSVKVLQWRHKAEKSKYNELLAKAQSPNCSHRDAKLFRRRFRVPVEVYNMLYARAKQVFSTKAFGVGNGKGAHAAPLSNKILACLRIVGRGLDYDTVAWESGLSESLIKKFFPTFVRWLGVEVYADEVTVPSGESLQHALKVYRIHGYPGCMCSVDGVHVAWDCCPAGSRWEYTGKEGYPTLAFNVCVTHTREIIHVSGPVSGKTNDLTQARYDEFLTKLRLNQVSPNIKFDLYTADGSLKEHTGVWAMCDNGYHNWRCLMPPVKHTQSCNWSRMLESMRKDVECTFGILKKRFRVLRLPMLYRSQEMIGQIFYSCCVLHNLLLRHDGLSTMGSLPEDWKQLDAAQVQAEWDARAARVRPPDIGVVPGTCDLDENFHAFRQELITHFRIHCRKHGVKWLKPAKVIRPSKLDARSDGDMSGENVEQDSDPGVAESSHCTTDEEGDDQWN